MNLPANPPTIRIVRRPWVFALLLSACDASSSLSDASSADAGAADLGPVDLGYPFDAASCTPGPDFATPDSLAAMRDACAFAAGAHVRDTLAIDDATRARLPIQHLIVVMQENRAYDQYFGRLHDRGQPDSEAVPPTYANPDATGASVAPFHLASTCLADDPPHQWSAMHAGWNLGAMDGFVRSAASATSDGHYVIGAYDDGDLPFYYWLANTFAISDRHFGAVLGGTWANRDYLYAGSSYGVKNTGDRAITEARTIFDALDAAGVGWGVYTDGTPRQDALGWDRTHAGVHLFMELLAQLHDGSLPAVAFVDPSGVADQHPPNDVQGGEAWTRRIVLAAIQSPLWPSLAVVHTYDESGGMADHVPPPPGCIPSADQVEFDRRGVRVPLIVVSPWARPHHVSHVVSDHTSITRLVELLFDLPALTARDANANALLDLFDFSCPPPLLNPGEAPASGVDGCR